MEIGTLFGHLSLIDGLRSLLLSFFYFLYCETLMHSQCACFKMNLWTDKSDIIESYKNVRLTIVPQIIK